MDNFVKQPMDKDEVHGAGQGKDSNSLYAPEPAEDHHGQEAPQRPERRINQ